MTLRRSNLLWLKVPAFLTALVGVDGGRAQAPAAADGGPTFTDRLREMVGLDGGKRRVLREALVRSPDGVWCLESANGLQPHPCHREYVGAEELFKRGQYSAAAKAFRKLGERYERSALQEDCLFNEAESYYQAGQLPSAVDTFHALLKEFPTTRHLTHAVGRSYKISEEWLEDSRLRSQGRPGKYNWWSRNVNLWDKRRPLIDANGRAIEAIERIQQYDPTGPLTAPATMMAGAERFTSGDYVQAAGYYEQVVVDTPKSELAARAAVLSAQSYLRSYQGPAYDAEDLLKAQKMTEEALKRAALLDADQVSKLEDDLKRIHMMRAERLFHDGQSYAGLRKWTGARYCYEQVIRRYPESSFAQKAKDELIKIAPKLPQTAEAQELKYEEESTWTLPKLNIPGWKSPNLLPKKDAKSEGKGDEQATEEADESVQLPPAKLPDSVRGQGTKLPNRQ